MYQMLSGGGDSTHGCMINNITPKDSDKLVPRLLSTFCLRTKGRQLASLYNMLFTQLADQVVVPPVPANIG